MKVGSDGSDTDGGQISITPGQADGCQDRGIGKDLALDASEQTFYGEIALPNQNVEHECNEGLGERQFQASRQISKRHGVGNNRDEPQDDQCKVIAENSNRAAKHGETGKTGHAMIKGGVVWTELLGTDRSQSQIKIVDFVPAPTTKRFDLQC